MPGKIETVGTAIAAIGTVLDPHPIRDQMRILGSASLLLGDYNEAEEMIRRLQALEPIGEALIAWGEAIRQRTPTETVPSPSNAGDER